MDQNERFTAVHAIAEIIKTSFGPNALYSLLRQETGDEITNCGWKLLDKLSRTVNHPAAVLAMESSKIQERYSGDGTTSVVIICSELLKQAELLMEKYNFRPSDVSEGFRKTLLGCYEMQATFLEFNQLVLQIRFDGCKESC
eukprot:TRINITY_DN12311_c0_g1_i1.p1 TRINITY_DN12311_c0_g1~~TRINITY_DN12311_c0_g1_i1.p1  ORF type:complete len:142 (-),score=9.12 TRINITY_DN12311_c0_g1_i1:196-621(-)